MVSSLQIFSSRNSSMTRRHLIEQPGLFGTTTLRCGIEGEVVPLAARGSAILKPSGWLYYIADVQHPATCRRCIEGSAPSMETRLKIKQAKCDARKAARGDQA